ncbi:hypothetical protein FVO59_14065 [Microbacterium esteraromaticum]|uniref:Dioxygenase n=1 Tax=Microbacterium esteraromaticum TaxID=57043 RepID=A0A7D8AMJ3_9MICO|nr:hypothetical protein [Microbacterium esteraromaticum]QMU98187.1 hypothetical protein FVO59_14065 [Microbacterium esteraromaticum]
MAARGSRTPRRTRTEAERARLYAARTAWNAKTIRRRRRDTIVATVVGALVVVGAFVSQAVHAQVTLPEPTPAETSTPVQTPSPSPSTSSAPDATPTQTPSE